MGADGGEASRPVLEYAFAQASLRRIPLTVMHCFWDVAAATGGKGVVQDDDKDLSDLRLLLGESVAGLAEKYPDVQVTQELARGLVDECLADLAPAAALLVVGRAERHGWSRFVHTSCALAVVERARTTVAVVPEHTQERNETMNAPTNAVVMGVGADGLDAALTFAVAEARRTQRPLHLVHVVEIPAGEAYAGMLGGMLDAAKATLEEAQQKAEELAGTDVPVTAELVDSGTVVNDLVRHTVEASLLVLQHRALSRTARILGGSVAHSVAGRAHVPVVSVPVGWTPRVGTDYVVTACVQDPAEAPALLRAAFEEARARSATLVVLHAWWLASGFDAVVVDNAYRDQYAADKHEEINPILAPLRAEFPDVECRGHRAARAGHRSRARRGREVRPAGPGPQAPPASLPQPPRVRRSCRDQPCGLPRLDHS